MEKIDKFYFVLGGVMLLMAVLVIFTFRTIFSSYINAYEVDQAAINAGLKVDEEKLNEAYNWVKNKDTQPIEVREQTFQVEPTPTP